MEKVMGAKCGHKYATGWGQLAGNEVCPFTNGYHCFVMTPGTWSMGGRSSCDKSTYSSRQRACYCEATADKKAKAEADKKAKAEADKKAEADRKAKAEADKKAKADADKKAEADKKAKAEADKKKAKSHDINEIVAFGGCKSVGATVLGEQECQTYAEGLGANQWHGFQGDNYVNYPPGCYRFTHATPSKVFFNRASGRVVGSDKYPVICKGKLLEIGNFKRVKSTTDGCREHKGFTELVRAECETWAHKEKLPLREDNSPNYPRGCYKYGNHPEIFFNIHSTGHHDSSTTLICKPEKQAASPPKPKPVDRHGSNCGANCDWKGKWWKAKGGVCDWCGIHKGKKMACCRSGYSDPGCDGTDDVHGHFHSCRTVAGSFKPSADEAAEEPSGSGSSRPLLTFVSVVVVSFILGFT